MGEIIRGRVSEGVFSSRELRQMYRFRHRVFSEQLGWDVNSQDGCEFDHFDALDPVYIVYRDDQGEIEACWRALPTTGPNMLADTFPELLAGESMPVASDVWELSRFAVQPAAPYDRGVQASASELTVRMLRAGYDMGVSEGLSDYVTVVSAPMERLLRQLGLPMQRFGDGRARRVGRVLSVAVHVPIGEPLRRALYDDTAAAQRDVA